MTTAPLNKAQRSITATNPATGAYLGEVPIMDRGEVQAIVERARGAQKSWAKTTFKERRAVLKTIMRLTLERHEEICRLSMRDSGKTMVDAALGEVFPVLEKLRYVIARGEKDLAPEWRKSGILAQKGARVEYHPLGVVGVICPWNFPFHNLLCPLVPALFAGNAVVSKVSEETSWSAGPYLQLVRDALLEHGHDPQLVQVVTGYGETGNALVVSGVEKVFFTGSPQNGRKVMEAASHAPGGPVDVVLELGGKDPMIVCDDADLFHAVEQAMLGVFTSCGQMCVGVERIYVNEKVYDTFIERVRDKVRNLRQGPPEAGVVDCGAMTMARQLEIIGALVEDAVEKGAKVIAGGERGTQGSGQYWKPTILTDVTHDMRIIHEEHFGPVMVIVKVQNDAEAIRLANDTEYGLGSSVFSTNEKRAEKIASQIRAGMTVINDYGIAYMIQSLPFGGVGISGVGRINGKEGLRACCYTKAVVTDRVPLGKGVSVYPIQKTTYDLVRAISSLVYTDSLRGRATQGVKAAGLFAREMLSRKQK